MKFGGSGMDMTWEGAGVKFKLDLPGWKLVIPEFPLGVLKENVDPSVVE